MVKGNRVTLSDSTMNGLAKFAKPFESADECLERILSCKCVQDEMKKQEKTEDDVVAGGDDDEKAS